ncbi:xanthine dehydrogenase family protein molybdopterin-binding subunit [Horticoccus sp. 23ND18S-11]|uniref:xanthine dehydrogenase family protein molybdopterin-binding subunit n=1 Tax=Horticoccus sp. 23ND18S-11 TaxID=3391832 RepID=UPI0039C9A77F
MNCPSPAVTAPDSTALSRRDFISRTAAGLTLSFLLPEFPGRSRLLAAEPAPDVAVTSWLTVGVDDTITLTIGASEMGQGSFSGLAQILAEDLMVDYGRIETIQGGPTTATPAPIGSAINTVGSGVTRSNYWRMRDAAAAAREMLVQAAMTAIGDPTRTNYSVVNGLITHVSTGTTRTYGQVAAAAALLPVPVGAPLVPDSEFRVIGKTQRRVDIPAKVDGSAIYGLDVRLPNMVYGIVRHCPTLGGTLAKTPATPSGMIAVVPTRVMTGTQRGLEAVNNVNAIIVVGPNTWDTWRASKKLSLSWTQPANAAALNSTQFLNDAKALANAATPYVAGGLNPPGTLYTVEGDATTANTAINQGASIVDAVYTLPYVAHACMEVLNCTVDYVPGVKCDVYVPTQSARSVLTLVATLTGLAPSQITVHTTYLGGGLGRKSEVDFVSQAVQAGMAVKRPIKVMWPREEDFTHDQFRPMAVIHARAGLNANREVTGWSYRNVSPSILAQRGSTLGPKGDSQGIEAAVALPYNLGARVTEYVTHTAPIPVGFWRSVGASLNTFGVESMIDELAFAAREDPYLFRRNRLTDARWVAVLDAAATLGGWNTPVPTGRFRGIAIGAAFNSIVAEVVEISAVTSTSLKVNRVSVAIDCYLAVNPGQVEAQLTGGVVHGLNAALYGKQNFIGGVPQSKNFNTSRMIRMNEMPDVKVTLIPNPAVADRTKSLGGVGELGVPTFAPALANAHFKATGNRVRTLPLFPNATMGGL